MKYLMLVFSIVLSFNSFGAIYHYMKDDSRAYHCDSKDKEFYKSAEEDNTTWPLSLLFLGICELAASDPADKALDYLKRIYKKR